MRSLYSFLAALLGALVLSVGAWAQCTVDNSSTPTIYAGGFHACGGSYGSGGINVGPGTCYPNANRLRFQFEVTASGDITLTTCGPSFGAQLTITDLQGGLVASSTSCPFTRTFSPGNYYAIVQGRNPVASGNVIYLQMSKPSTLSGPPVGSNMSTPFEAGSLTCGVVYTDLHNNGPRYCFGNDYDAALGSNYPNGQPSDDIYYRFTLPERSRVDISTCDAAVPVPTYVHLLDANGQWLMTSSGGSTSVLCNGSPSASLQPVLDAGTYYVVTEGPSGTYWDIQLRLSALPLGAPAVTVLPTNPTVDVGYSITLTASGACATSFVWRDVTGAIVGSGPALTVQPIVTTTYTVTGTSATGATTVVTVTVTVRQNLNYITTNTVLIPGKQTVSQVTAMTNFDQSAGSAATAYAVRQQQTTYFDELGRAIQQVQVQASPNQKDVVTPVAYDALGRQAISYLPYAGSTTTGLGNNGLFQANAFSQQAAFYQRTTLPGGQLDHVVNDPAPSTSAVYEASPLSRVLEDGAPGAAWQAGTGHTRKTQLRGNVDDEVRLWVYDPVGNTWSSPRAYAAEQLQVKETRDEQDQLVTEFTDLQGKPVLKKVSIAPTTCDLQPEGGTILLTAPTGMVISAIRSATFGHLLSGSSCSNSQFVAGESADVTSYVQAVVGLGLGSNVVSFNVNAQDLGPAPYAGQKYLQVVAAYQPASGASTDLLTYYAYDDLNNLRLVISPEGYNNLASSGSWTPTENLLRNLCYRYEYDDRARVTQRQVPGTDAVLLVYNRRGQVVLTQDGNQRQLSPAEWSFTKYDNLGRPVMTGAVTLPGETQTSLQTALNAETVLSESINNTAGGVGYTLTNAYPRSTGGTTTLTASNLLTVTYYDNYNAPFLNTSQLQSTLPTDQRMALPRGLSTGSSVRMVSVGTTLGSWLTTATYYDKYYRVVQSRAQNQLDGVTDQQMTYDFAGKLLASSTQVTQLTGTGPGYTDTKSFTYDGGGRLGLTNQSVGGQPSLLLSKYSYNEIGQLVTRWLHSTDGVKFLQKVDYRYNIRGWLTHINNRNLNGTFEEGPGVTVQDPDDPATTDPDLFGMELRYNSPEQNGATAQYNGNVAQALWQTRTDKASNNVLRAFNYSYDPANRITGAQFQTATNSGWSTNQATDFTVSNIRYDANGNLTRMTRMGTVNGNNSSPVKGTMDDLTYTYSATVNGVPIVGNQLLAVDDAATNTTSTHDFQDRGAKFNSSGQVEYDYDKNGNVKRDANKSISSIQYSRLNQPTEINLPSTRIQYTYTATGQKLQKRLYTTNAFGGSAKLKSTTNYVGPLVFSTAGEKSTPLFAQTSEGRVLYTPATNGTTLPWKYEYHLKDHLGNLRFAFRADKDGTVTTQRQASMEPANASEEEQQFKHVAETRLADPAHARTGSYVARLDARTGRREGPSLRLAVAAGDSVRAEVYGRYDRGGAAGSLWQRGAIIAGGTTIGASGVGTPEQAPTGLVVRRRWLPLLGASVAIVPQVLGTKKAELPVAYLRYQVFTQDSQLVSTQVQALRRTPTDEWQPLRAGLKVDSAGFVRVSLVNESPVPAYFDDLTVERVAPSPYQENHYDPFGLNLVGIEQTGEPNSAYQYNGKEKQEDGGLNWTDYGARFYDAQLGRWHAPDPLSDIYAPYSPYNYCVNNPVRLIDPKGRNIWDVNGTQAQFKFNGQDYTITNCSQLDSKFKEALLNTLAFSSTGADEVRAIAEDKDDHQLVVSDKAGFGVKDNKLGSFNGLTAFNVPLAKGAKGPVNGYDSVSFLFNPTVKSSDAIKDVDAFDFVTSDNRLASREERLAMLKKGYQRASSDAATDEAIKKLPVNVWRAIQDLSEHDKAFGYVSTCVHELRHAQNGNEDEVEPYMMELQNYQNHMDCNPMISMPAAQPCQP